MKILFLFVDGVGLGNADPETNPFARASLPALSKLLGGSGFFAASAPLRGQNFRLQALDASLGVDGLPQSATGQAVLLTGRNVPAEIGYHYGPKPNPEIAAFLQNGALFGALTRAGKSAALLSAYPDGYFQAIQSGRRNFSAIPMAASRAGLTLFTQSDLQAGRALSADLTGLGWRERMNRPEIPLLTPRQAGTRLAELAQAYDFSLFEYWLSDYAGHRQEMAPAVTLLEEFDAMLGGLLSAWDARQNLLLLTSDHGNLEDLSTRRHTANPVPLLLFGPPAALDLFDDARSLTQVAPKMESLLRLA
ncbi:MAG: metalloenzyme [Anaerolineales bacterium]